MTPREKTGLIRITEAVPANRKRAADRKPAYLTSPSFSQWLYHVREQPAFRELYAFVESDRDCWPNRARTLTTFIQHCASHDEAPSEASIRSAYASFTADVRKGIKIPRRLGPDPLPEAEQKDLTSYWITKSTAECIKRIQKLLYGKDGGSRGAAIDAATKHFEAHLKQQAKRK